MSAAARRKVRRREMPGVLHNFLQAFASRYSDYDGYWLFGILLPELNGTRIDLLDASNDANDANDANGATPMVHACRIARARFAQQLERGGFRLSDIEAAVLSLERTDRAVTGTVGGHVCRGYDVRLVVVANMRGDHEYRSEASFFVAPHDPDREQRSARGS